MEGLELMGGWGGEFCGTGSPDEQLHTISICQEPLYGSWTFVVISEFREMKVIPRCRNDRRVVPT